MVEGSSQSTTLAIIEPHTPCLRSLKKLCITKLPVSYPLRNSFACIGVVNCYLYYQETTNNHRRFIIVMANSDFLVVYM
jgi:hypothetical protein